MIEVVRYTAFFVSIALVLWVGVKNVLAPTPAPTSQIASWPTVAVITAGLLVASLA